MDTEDRKRVATYVSKAKQRLTHQIAASAWSNGVPYDVALTAAAKAVAAGEEAAAFNAPPNPKGRGRGKGKGKAAA